MKLYLVSQDVNDNYDTYDSFVVACENEEEARTTNPGGFRKWRNDSWYFKFADGTEKKYDDRTWCLPSQVKVEHLGEAKDGVKKGIVCSSFNAG